MTRPTRFPLRVGAKRGCVQVSRAEDSAADPLTAGSRVFFTAGDKTPELLGATQDRFDACAKLRLRETSSMLLQRS